VDSCGLARLPNSLVFLTSLEMTPVCQGSLTVYESEGHRFDSRGLEPDIVLGKIPQPRRTDFGFWSKRSDSVSDGGLVDRCPPTKVICASSHTVGDSHRSPPRA
jgi:hypothetical protein